MRGIRTALYCRLSKDDEKQGDSESIITQKAMLTQYAKEQGFLVVGIYVDDGYSGLYFDRPDFNRMLEDIENGKIDIVITKDLSRLGRDHLQVGHYTEIYFPLKNVRYIAINDMVDTENKNNDIGALKNVMNEFYSRDNSRKIKASIKARAKLGLYRSTFSPLGYKKATDNHNKLIIDEETAPIIREIFKLAVEGYGSHKIARILRDEKKPCPGWWLYSRGERNYSEKFENPENKYKWHHSMIRSIIKNPLYIGSVVNCKTETVFKTRRCKKIDEKERIKVDNMHEPLVSKEDFMIANNNILSRKRVDNFGNVSIFAGLLKCGDCKKAMNQRYWTKKRYKIYICGTYAENTKDCKGDHRIFYDDLYNAVLQTIREHASLALNDRENAIKQAKKQFEKIGGNKVLSNENKLKQMKKRYEDITRLFDKLYEDSLSGRITNDNFNRLISKYQNEQEELLQQIEKLEEELKKQNNFNQGAINWAEKISEYSQIKELNAEILNSLIERIEVYSRKQENGKFVQNIEIFYRFGGCITEVNFNAKDVRHQKCKAS